MRSQNPPDAWQVYANRREVLDEIGMRERVFRYAIAGFVVLFAVAGLLTLMSRDGPRSPWGIALVCAFAVSTVPVGLAMTRLNHVSAWWSHRTSFGATELFVLYADIGLTAVLITFHDAGAALVGSTLFAVIGTYVAHFVLPAARVAHIVFSSGAVIGIGVWCVMTDTFDLPGAAARVLVALMVINGTVTLHSVYTKEVRMAILDKHRMATTDPLTGIANRRAFMARARRLLSSSERAVVVMLVDIDDFKAVNDTHGHDRGDETLARVAAAIDASVPDGAVIGRLGGDEFGVAAPADHRGDFGSGLAARVTESAGVRVTTGSAEVVCPAPDPASALTRALSMADANLYARKKVRER